MAVGFNNDLKKQHVIWSDGKHLASVSMETTASLPSQESVNTERTRDDSYKLSLNLVISHFHAGMNNWITKKLEVGLERSFYGLTFGCMHGTVQHAFHQPLILREMLWEKLERMEQIFARGSCYFVPAEPPYELIHFWFLGFLTGVTHAL